MIVNYRRSFISWIKSHCIQMTPTYKAFGLNEHFTDEPDNLTHYVTGRFGILSLPSGASEKISTAANYFTIPAFTWRWPNWWWKNERKSLVRLGRYLPSRRRDHIFNSIIGCIFPHLPSYLPATFLMGWSNCYLSVEAEEGPSARCKPSNSRIPFTPHGIARLMCHYTFASSINRKTLNEY